MIKEKYTTIDKELCLSIVANKVSSVRMTDKTSTGYRVYDGKYIGVAGAIGAHEPDKLFEDAKRALANKIDYPYAPSQDNKRTEIYNNANLDEKQFVEMIESLLPKLAARFPSFVFSHKCYLSDVTTAIENDGGLDLLYRLRDVYISFLINRKGSGNIFDTGFFAPVDLSSENDLIDDMACLLDNFDNKVDIPDGNYPVICNYGEVFADIFSTHLNPDRFSKGASLLSGKRGEKLFNESFTLSVDRSCKYFPARFFDVEGTTLEGDRINLIDKGVLISPYAAKRENALYGYNLSGNAAGAYDAAPVAALAYASPLVSVSLDSLKNEKCIFVDVTSGGDFTPSGDFACPVQSAYLIENGKFAGKLPQINISGNLFGAFGEGYIGAAENSLFKIKTPPVVVSNLKVYK